MFINKCDALSEIVFIVISTCPLVLVLKFFETFATGTGR